MNRLKSIIYIIFLLSCCSVFSQEHPHILVTDDQKQDILNLIQQQPWAKSVYERIKKDVDPYVDRHQADSTWILDRYLMNRVPGKRFTHFISDKSGTELIGYEGDAPVPTVRVSPHKRLPVTPQGQAYRFPTIDELIPNDTATTMNLFNPDTKQYDRVNPQSYVGGVNSKINDLAYKSSVLYWLTSDEKYAKFSADILNQWGRGAYYQQPIEGPGRTGFLNIQTLGDDASKALILAYDFVYPYMKRKGYDLSYYDTVFDKIAATLAFRGYVDNNWYAAESSTMVAAALAIQDEKKRAYYLDFYLKRDTVRNGYGQLGMPSTVKRWFTSDGHWKEPGGYHNYPVARLIESAFMLENNGYKVFQKYPILLKAAYVMLKYSYPDLTASSFGDTGRPRQDYYCLEIGIKMAEHYQLPILKDLLQVMDLFRARNLYDRATAGVTGLLCYSPTVPEGSLASGEELWKRTGKLDFASFYLQRNGTSLENGLMCILQGATYNHNHCNGMAMELYGKGTVMGADPGCGLTYEHPLHVGYYAQWAAHNTIVSGGSSSSVSPFTGGGGVKRIGAVKLAGMEPLADSDAISEDYSFIQGKYEDISTKTQQERLLSLIRVDSLHGYYLDIYYSDNKISNDYLYHNIGDTVSFYTPKRKEIPVSAIDSYPLVGEDFPGLRYFKSVSSTGIYSQPIVAVFPMESTSKQMNMWMPASPAKSYYTAWAPPTISAITPYNKKPTPVVAIRMEQEAESNPFVVVYEPTDQGMDKGCIRSVEQFGLGNKQLVVRLDLKGDKKQTIFKGNGTDSCCWKSYAFKGVYGIVTEDADQTKMYLGEGKLLENQDMRISVPGNGAVFLDYSMTHLYIRVNNTCLLSVKNSAIYKKINAHIATHSGLSHQSDTSILFKKGYYKIPLY